ncbi:hypothetical protein SYNPS1DRAFT_27766 [Syncephalis pseudoplumigaleata]|uniref:Uncharacterized protein n=1 Tax=Syncephalis pseudoplumigaleata TaxID=1712513 RepID=A0A4P9Z2G1_9FUNG|nr:hypothetical protein SYNPS1DRAFT_27766 [Syncephalis pseudoplumigaleata]|eukprot:RKP26555.1 hypothetical protein SYNPS1DRAFT_27766 [Syncephalis pseudoplumigaleata]
MADTDCRAACSGNASVYCGGNYHGHDERVIGSIYYQPLSDATRKVAMAMTTMPMDGHATTTTTTTTEFSSHDCAAIASGTSLGAMLFTGISCALFYWCYLRPSLICLSNQRRYEDGGNHLHRSSAGTTTHGSDESGDEEAVPSSTKNGTSHASTSSRGRRSRRRYLDPTTDGNLDEVSGARRWWIKHLGRDRSKTMASSMQSNAASEHGADVAATTKAVARSRGGRRRVSASVISTNTAPSRMEESDYEYYYGEESDSGDGRKHSFHVDRRAVLRGIEAGHSPYTGIGAATSAFPTAVPPRSYDGQHGGIRRGSLSDVFPPLSAHLPPYAPPQQDWYDLRPAGPGIGSIASDLHDSLDYTPRLRIANPSRRYSSNLTGDSASEMSNYTCMTNSNRAAPS